MRRLAVVAAAVLLAAPAFGGAIASAGPSSPRWSVVPSASPPAPVTSSLRGVACPTPSSCFAVGIGDALASPTALRLTGVSWSIVPIAPAGDLSAIACPGAATCVAVGRRFDSGAGVLVEMWDGTSWSIVPAPSPASAFESELAGVSCVSATDCFAVGSAKVHVDIDIDGTDTLVEHWDGSSWSIVASPNPARTFDSSLAGVSCVTATSCYAVGAGSGTLVERWDGSAWSMVDSNLTGSTASVSALSSISCASTGPCVAVGSTVIASSPGEPPDTEPFVENVSGSAVAIGVAPNPAVSRTSGLTGVSCPSATSCDAVGTFVSGSDFVTRSLVEHFDGTGWSIDSTGTGSALSRPDAVSCPAVAACVAVGSGFIGRRSGARWSFDATGGSQSELRGVSCVSATDCFAVGDYSTDGLAITPLIEHWNGTTWSFVASPRPASGPTDSRLTRVSCPTSTTCFAVGAAAVSKFVPLVERWNGKQWSVVTGTQPAGAIESFLTDISCANANSCLAIGNYITEAPRTGEHEYGLVERWDGTKWSIAGAKLPDFGLLALDCVTATDCIATGASPGTSRPTLGVFAARWTGKAFTALPTPPRPDPYQLPAVSCASATSCFAVGVEGPFVNPDTLQGNMLIERWNGKRWSVVPSPNGGAGTYDNALTAVSCATPTSCVALGFSLSGTINVPVPKRLVARWDGKRWSAAAVPEPPHASSDSLAGVSCVTSVNCVAVGDYTLSGSRWTLAERFS